MGRANVNPPGTPVEGALVVEFAPLNMLPPAAPGARARAVAFVVLGTELEAEEVALS